MLNSEANKGVREVVKTITQARDPPLGGGGELGKTPWVSDGRWGIGKDTTGL